MNNYIAKLELIIKRALSAASRRRLSPEDLRDTAEDWFDIIDGKIPVEHLEAVEKKANEMKRDSNPLTPYDLTYAFVILQKDMPSKFDIQKGCSYERNGFHVEGKKNMIYSANYGSRERITIPCPICRTDEPEIVSEEDAALIKEAYEAVTEKIEMSPLDRTRQKWKETFKEFNQSDFNDRSTQGVLSEKMKKLRAKELELMKEENRK